MKCFKCEDGKESAFFSEKFPCHSCEEPNVIEYNLCPDCGWMWRSINDVPAEGSEMHLEDMGDFMSMMFGEQPELTEEEQEIMDNITEHMEKVTKMDSGEATMGDYIHKCLKCNSTAVDVNDGVYECRDCGFDWEIIKFE